MSNIFNLNSSTGVVGSDTGINCSSGSGTVFVSNVNTVFNITSVTNLPGYTLPSTLSAGQSDTGTHSGNFTGIILVNISGSASTANLVLTVNSVFIECVQVDSSGVYGFTNRSYNGTDSISIVFSDGACA